MEAASDSRQPLIVARRALVSISAVPPSRTVIIDEEHEPSFKQYDPAPRYNARDAAIVLASMHGAKTLLGSATPSVETYYKALNGKYALVSLEERFEGATLPDVEIVDMRAQRKQRINRGILSGPLRLATEEALKEGRQAIMFRNRRGFAPVVVCRECGWTPKMRQLRRLACLPQEHSPITVPLLRTFSPSARCMPRLQGRTPSTSTDTEPNA